MHIFLTYSKKKFNSRCKESPKLRGFFDFLYARSLFYRVSSSIKKFIGKHLTSQIAESQPTEAFEGALFQKSLEYSFFLLFQILMAPY